MTFAQKLKDIRAQLGLSQEQLAEKLHVSRQAVTKWESGEGMPDTFNIKALAQLSGQTLDYLLDNDTAHTDQPMSFIDSIRDTFIRFSDFEGRTNRQTFWWYALFYVLILALCGIFDFVALQSETTLGTILASIFVIVTLVPSLAVGVRRLRDCGESWKQMLWLLLPFFGIVYVGMLWARPSLIASDDSI